MKTFTRITADPNQMGGLRCIRGLRMPVATIVGMVGLANLRDAPCFSISDL